MINVFRTSIEEVKNYRNNEAISQSYLKQLDTHLDSFKNKEDKKETLSMLKGSIVDCILTGKEGDFEKLYYVSDLEFDLSDVEKEIINLTFSLIINSKQEVRNLDDHLIALNNAISQIQWFNGKPGEKRIETLVGKARGYFEELKLSYGKTIIKKSLLTSDIDPVVQSLMTHLNTHKFFRDIDTNDNSVNLDIFYQLPIFFKYEEVDCKALLDILLVFKDKEGYVEKVIVVDLKTTDMFTLDFVSSVQSFRYDIQAAFYSVAVRTFIENNYKVKETKINITNYEQDFMFVVESFKKQNPIVFHTTPEFLATGMWGYKTPYKTVKGFVDLLRLHKYYVENEWKQDKLLQENDGILTLTFDNSFKIYEDSER